MTFEMELDGVRRAVSVEPAGSGRYRVIVDGQPHEVQAVRIGGFALSLILQGAAGTGREPVPAGESHEIHVVPGAARGELLVGLKGRVVPVVVDGRTRRRSGADRAEHGDGEATVIAPMPGRVVRVLVGPGDEVTARQGVVVVEAMKMENELRSPKAGRVRDVKVTPGTSVEAGRVLVVIA